MDDTALVNLRIRSNVSAPNQLETVAWRSNNFLDFGSANFLLLIVCRIVRTERPYGNACVIAERFERSQERVCGPGEIRVVDVRLLYLQLKESRRMACLALKRTKHGVACMLGVLVWFQGSLDVTILKRVFAFVNDGRNSNAF